MKDNELKLEEVADSTTLIGGEGEGVVEGLIFPNNLLFIIIGGIHDSVCL